jgi:hypothetical protein
LRIGLGKVSVALPPSPNETTVIPSASAIPNPKLSKPKDALPSKGFALFKKPRLTTIPFAQLTITEESLWMAVDPICPAAGAKLCPKEIEATNVKNTINLFIKQ